MKAKAELVLDVGSVRNRDELHRLLAMTFHFPDYYGHNWDAFDECIRDVPVPDVICITGFQKLHCTLPREATLLSMCLQSFATKSGGRKVVHVS